MKAGDTFFASDAEIDDIISKGLADHWVDAKLRLPTMGETVLFWSRKSCWVGYYCNKCTPPCWHLSSDQIMSYRDVTHWMPLPEEPE